MAAALAGGGGTALASRSAGGGLCELTAGQLAKLEAVLDAGAVVSGWNGDQAGLCFEDESGQG